MRGDIPPLPQYIFIVWCFVKQRENFNFHREPVNANRDITRSVGFKKPVGVLRRAT